MLLADVALPVLLSSWGEYYQKVTQEWMEQPKHLSELERLNFQWDHAQAGAWILQNWEFPVELVCFVGLHNTGLEKLEELELTASVALPVVVAAQAPSSLKPDQGRAEQLVTMAMEQFGYSDEEMLELLEGVRIGFNEVSDLFELSPSSGDAILDLLEQCLTPEEPQDG